MRELYFSPVKSERPLSGGGPEGQVSLNHILICGLGSVGQRHLQHFLSIGVSRIDAFRTGRGTIKMEGLSLPGEIFYSLDEALRHNPEAVIVANPTASHLSTAQAAIQSGAHVLIEKPISHNLTGCEELLGEAKTRARVVAVGCNLRFHPLLVVLEGVVSNKELGRPLTASAHFCTYLPDWHPWEDFHQSYAARCELGGGVALTHIHEIDYLLWLFGPAVEVEGFSLRIHPLGTNVEEASVGIIRHQQGTLSSLNLSFCQKPQRRNLQIFFEKGYAYLDFLANTLELENGNGHVKQINLPEGFSMSETYAEQARAFAARVAGYSGNQLCSGTEAIASLRVALKVRGKGNG
jgi:predicted dehydrogenase